MKLGGEECGFGFPPKFSLFVPIGIGRDTADLVFRDLFKRPAISGQDILLNRRRENKSSRVWSISERLKRSHSEACLLPLMRPSCIRRFRWWARMRLRTMRAFCLCVELFRDNEHSQESRAIRTRFIMVIDIVKEYKAYRHLYVEPQMHRFVVFNKSI